VLFGAFETPAQGPNAPWQQGLWVYSLVFFWGCASAGTAVSAGEMADPDIVPLPPGETRLEKLSGPMLKPFDSYAEAVTAACERIFQKPRSSAGRKPAPTALREEQVAFQLRWQVATEYCGWLYYTPDGKYEISRLTAQGRTDPTGRSKSCLTPSEVMDARYPAGSIQYIFVLHGHPFDTPISEDDIRFIEYQGSIHGFNPRTKDGELRISIVAGFSNDDGSPSCDGFYLYSAQTRRILKWSRSGSHWTCEQTHAVAWHDYGSLDLEIRDEKAPCAGKGTP
jgi:hypothetical protein